MKLFNDTIGDRLFVRIRTELVETQCVVGPQGVAEYTKVSCHAAFFSCLIVIETECSAPSSCLHIDEKHVGAGIFPYTRLSDPMSLLMPPVCPSQKGVPPDSIEIFE